MGNASAIRDPCYLPAAAAAGATVVAPTSGWARCCRPDAPYEDVVLEVAAFSERAGWARAAGLRPDQIVVDAGLDLGKTWQQSLVLLRASDHLPSSAIRCCCPLPTRRFWASSSTGRWGTAMTHRWPPCSRRDAWLSNRPGPRRSGNQAGV